MDTRETGYAKRDVRELRIIMDYNYDRNFYIVQDNNGDITSLNFWHGVEEIDYDYAANDADLLKEFNREWFCREETAKLIDVLNKAAEIHLIKKNEDWRENIICNIVDEHVNQIFVECHEKCFTVNGDITPGQTFELERITNELKKLIGQQITQNLK